MKTKATKNLESAQLLINNGYHTTSIHCSYYAVFQQMKYILAHTKTKPITYNEQDNQNKNSHEHILTEVANRIPDYRKVKSFTESFRELKRIRILADYTTDEYNADDSTKTKQKAEGLIANLKTYFGNL